MPGNRDLRLDTLTHDIAIRGRDLSIVEGAAATSQRLKVRLKLFFRSWYLNLLAGIPYYETILQKNPDLLRLEAEMKLAITTVDNVLELLNLDLALDNQTRRLTILFSVRTSDGTINDQVQVNI